MDILAHGQWAGVGIAALGRQVPVTRHTAVMPISLAALPDVLQMLPVVGWWWLGGSTLAATQAFAIAVPGQAPLLPAAVLLVPHQLHCTAHSAVVAGLVTALGWQVRPALRILLLG